MACLADSAFLRLKIVVVVVASPVWIAGEFIMPLLWHGEIIEFLELANLDDFNSPGPSGWCI